MLRQNGERSVPGIHVWGHNCPTINSHTHSRAILRTILSVYVMWVVRNETTSLSYHNLHGHLNVILNWANDSCSVDAVGTGVWRQSGLSVARTSNPVACLRLL